MDFDSMKYADLRSLAKELGLKANVKADKLLKAIKQHYQQEKNNEKEGQGQDVDNVPDGENVAQGDVKESPKEEASSSAVFVNTRRGKRDGTKRRITAAATVTGPQDKRGPKPAEVEVEECSKPGNARAAKKRKVSSDKDSKDTPEDSSEQQQPDVKEEAPAPVETEKAPKVAKAGKIPRYQGLQQKRTTLKPITPNFKKLHEAQFNKMESIDTYVQRKTKQMGSFRNPVKELKEISNKSNQQAEGKPQVRTSSARAALFSPPAVTKELAEDKRRHTLLSASKGAGKGGLFRPSVLSTRRINVRFSEATRDNEFKRSLVKTPARMSLCLISSTPQKQTAEKTSSVKTSAQKTPVPFVFTANTSALGTPGTQRKQNFDLKASLSRPLTWKPHKGKLKPFGETQENTAGNKSQITNARQETYKRHKVQSREERRAKQAEGRKQKKESVLGARRGLVMM